MSSEFVIKLAGEAIYTVLKVSLPLMLLALAVGLIISVFQATTQIQEQTLAFVPKIIAVLVALLFFGRWMITSMVDFTYSLLNNLHNFIG
ncbi:flagellar biosynthesis protein FliQ [Marinicrinis lubricantis]|uniref:Flagellar biosynthetic protein FliQ n=1 Tax=Marinicrinis lubricantis TaxID=2086470 RepID=A0ABW1IMD3_9BACL